MFSYVWILLGSYILVMSFLEPIQQFNWLVRILGATLFNLGVLGLHINTYDVINNDSSSEEQKK